ncbi:hypothetical protein ABWL39_10235 [Chitinivorax sp. PXF-14]|uniref:hypothetical protein n=1 Tax=Chitinivorax sp. PXF-14 TaxID=3230488 RepID=UPI00346719B4
MPKPELLDYDQTAIWQTLARPALLGPDCVARQLTPAGLAEVRDGQGRALMFNSLGSGPDGLPWASSSSRLWFLLGGQYQGVWQPDAGWQREYCYGLPNWLPRLFGIADGPELAWLAAHTPAGETLLARARQSGIEQLGIRLPMLATGAWREGAWLNLVGYTPRLMDDDGNLQRFGAPAWQRIHIESGTLEAPGLAPPLPQPSTSQHDWIAESWLATAALGRSRLLVAGLLGGGSLWELEDFDAQPGVSDYLGTACYLWHDGELALSDLIEHHSHLASLTIDELPWLYLAPNRGSLGRSDELLLQRATPAGRWERHRLSIGGIRADGRVLDFRVNFHRHGRFFACLTQHFVDTNEQQTCWLRSEDGIRWLALDTQLETARARDQRQWQHLTALAQASS